MLLFLVAGCSTEKKRQIATLKSLDHPSIWAQLNTFRTSSDWPTERTFSKIEDGKSKTVFRIPNQILELNPWGVFVVPDNPPQIEFAFWVPSETWERDTVSLVYVFDDGVVTEGLHEEEASLEDAEITITAKIEKVAKSTYLKTSE